jgi:glycosyltransferase involved in cell wall biosynthesis
MQISIAMCTYNGDRFIGEQLRSLRKQTKPPFELIVCDDGSTDATPQLVRDFAASVTFPVVFVANGANLGSTGNFDQAINLSRGQAIALCDQDDVWAANKLERLAQVLEKEPGVGGVFSNAALINEESELLPESLWERRKYTPRRQAEFRRIGAEQLLKYNPATGATLVLRSSFVPQISPIPNEWVHDAWIALLVATQSRLAMVPERLISYRIHSAQQIGVKRLRPSDDLLVEKWTALENRLTALLVDPMIRRIANQKLQFFKTRQALKQRTLVGRARAASGALPGYFHFARGLLSYALDVAGVES